LIRATDKEKLNKGLILLGRCDLAHMRMAIVIIALALAGWFAIHWQNVQAERERQVVTIFQLKWAVSNNKLHTGGTYGSFSECRQLAVKILAIPSTQAWCEPILGSCYGKSCPARRR
jgi:hypothetical protein